MTDGTFVKELAHHLERGVVELKLHGIDRLALRQADGSYHVAEGIENPEPMAAALEVTTLGALVAFLREGIEDIDYDNAFLHVVDPTTVRLLSPASADPFARRQKHAAACAQVPDIAFGRYGSAEELLISLMSCFDAAGDRDALIAALSNRRSEKVKQEQDDGMSQVVTVRAGVSLVSERKVNSLRVLAPRRTFVEVAQPESTFILRLKDGTDTTPMQAALFEADGGAWRHVAMANVKTFLETAIAGLDEDRRVPVIW